MGALGLTLATKLNGAPSVDGFSYVQTFTKMLQWSIGPGLVAVCITYFMDRQLSSDLPNIDTSIVARRIVNSVIFAVFTIVLQLPPLLALQASADASWDSNKLRFVAVGATFVVTLSLALVSQFGLRTPQRQALMGAPQAAE
jgi:ABC-type glycerol-3-phosphate transport system permease component